MNDIAKRVLIVEDDKNTRTALAELIELTLDGVEVDAAGDGDTALGMAAKHDYPIALVDIMMPGLDGIDTARKLREMQPQVKILFLSGAGHEHYRERATDIIGAQIFTKPIDADQIMAIVAKTLGLRP